MSRKKTTLIIIITVLFLIVFSQIFAANISHFAPEYAVTTTNVNLRNMPNTEFSSFVRTLKKGEKIKLVGTIDNYYIVQTEKNEVGIVTKEYVDINGEKADTLTYTDYSPFYAKIKGNGTLVRGGPSTNFRVYGRLNAQDTVYVIGKIDNFLLVITENNLVGMIREDLLECVDNCPIDDKENTDNNNNNSNNTPSNESKANANYILEKINKARKENGLQPFTIYDLLQTTAQTKAQDMVKNNYFSHDSPTYGSPFEMMKNAGISYYSAGENIAGNNNIDEAIDSFLNSEDHRKNLLSNAYNYIGIGIEKSDEYGYIIVLMFIGK